MQKPTKSKKYSAGKKTSSFLKYLLAILFILLIILGFTVGLTYQKQKTPVTSNNQETLTSISDKRSKPILAKTIESFDFTDTFNLSGEGGLTFTIADPQKAIGTVNLQKSECTNGISGNDVIAIKHLATMKYWCSDSINRQRSIGDANPAAFIIHANIKNSTFETVALRSNNYFRSYYQDPTTQKWRQTLSMSNVGTTIPSKNELNLIYGFDIPKEAEKVILVAGLFKENSILKDSVQRCYLFDFTKQEADRTSCNVVW